MVEIGEWTSEISAAMRVLSDEKRLLILRLLFEGELCVCEIMERLGLSQSLASHHLRVLKESGLLRDRRDAQWIYYSIDAAKLAQLQSLFSELLDTANLALEARQGAALRKRC